MVFLHGSCLKSGPRFASGDIKANRETALTTNESLPRIRAIHSCDLARNRRPLELSTKRQTPPNSLSLLPLQELVCESQVRLDDDVEAAGSDEATVAERTKPLASNLPIESTPTIDGNPVGNLLRSRETQF
jgi:hypothetical protein